MKFIGIDPGVNGGVAWYDSKESSLSYAVMPPTVADICALFKDINSGEDKIAYMEKLTFAQGGRAVINDDGTRTFRRTSNPRTMGILGRNVGVIEGCLMGQGIQMVSVVPQKWMRAIGGTMSGLSCYDKTKWKNHLKALAQELYPKAKITLAIADALLIMTYGFRQTTGQDVPVITTINKWKTL